MKDRKEEEKEFHDRLQSELADDPFYTSNKKFYSIAKSSRDYVKSWLAERCKDKRVLDYCCGDGDFTIWLAEAGADAFGIDISPISIQNARAEAERRGLGAKVTFAEMDAEAMSFSDDYFDIVAGNAILHHLDLEKAYPELARVLKPQGEAIFREALRHNPLFQLYRKMTPHLRTAWEAEHILGKKEIEMAGQYFNSVKVLKFFHLATITSVLFRSLPIFEPIRRSLEAVDSILLRLPILKWQAWIGVFVLAEPKKRRGPGC